MASANSPVSYLNRLLGGQGVLRTRVGRYRGFADLVREGLPHASLTALCEILDVHEQELADVLGIASRTLSRRAGGRLRPDESDRLFRVAKVLARAAEVLGSQERASSWMKSQHVALGNQAPLHLLDTEIGEDEVLALLGRIEHGVVS